MSVAETGAPIALDVADGVARLRLNRPEASNGMNVEFLKALHEAALACHADPAVRVVLLTGEGRNFCAGGGGLGWVSASDIVIAARSAKFFSGAVRVGMAPDGGASVTLAQLVGLRQALRILLTNPTLSATEALQIGLVTEVVDDAELFSRAEQVATELAAMPPRALSATKRLVWSGLGASVEQRLAEEARTVSELSGTADALEGLRAVIERREPNFTGQ